MKKTLLIFALVSLFFASCESGSTTTSSEVVTDSTAVAVDSTTVVDSTTAE